LAGRGVLQLADAGMGMLSGLAVVSARAPQGTICLNSALIVTAMQRRETNTRDRDFADLWVTSRTHRLNATELREHVQTVAGHREQPIMTMAQALAHIPDRQQPYAAMVARMSYLSPPPELWRELVDGVITFLDPNPQQRQQPLLPLGPGAAAVALTTRSGRGSSFPPTPRAGGRPAAGGLPLGSY
jgi:hypothetical protein